MNFVCRNSIRPFSGYALLKREFGTKLKQAIKVGTDPTGTDPNARKVIGTDPKGTDPNAGKVIGTDPKGTDPNARKTRQGCKRHERGFSANLRCKKVSSHGLVDPARLQEAQASWLDELAVQESKLSLTRQVCKRHERSGSANLLCKNLNSHGLADQAMLQEARASWLGELAVMESKLARDSSHGKVARGTSETRQGCKRHKRGGSASLRCRKVSSHGLANPARLQEARGRWLSELEVQESKLTRVSRPDKVSRGKSEVESKLARVIKPGKVARGTSEVARRTCGAGSANLLCRKVNSNGLADRARLQEARARWLGELAVQESKLARLTRQGCKRDERGGSANLRCRKVSSHGLANPARSQEARARWLSELAVQESKLARVARGTSEIGQGCKRNERSGSANLRCKKLNLHRLADPTMLQEARARWLGELAVMESKLSLTRQGCKRHERRGSANLRCKKLNTQGLADPARLKEARAWWLGELAVHESKLARVSGTGKVARGTSEVARQT
ncbi:hypothetical protein CDL15_Pgr007985 [Punica granatum]|uniref:Uncharacterized protein n=1 Tax=Punica granatum TaxID=22663 RepID=A0A218WXI4_PUNGR|nr:hypothetical protein CDL15_Pgr007985 [Punica granatum]